jgi:hypothetical protein
LDKCGAIRINTLTDGTHNWIVVDWDHVALAANHSVSQTFEAWLGIDGVLRISLSFTAP